MKPALTLPPASWMQEAKTLKIIHLLNDGAQEPSKAMFVGGCVRNWLLGEVVQDIDIATSLLPNEVVKTLESAQVKVIPTGIDHGTVMAVVEGVTFEITTLRHDVETDGRHATVSYTQSWLEDAKRRDFTMNTLLADLSGNIYDPLGCGIEDAKARRVVFVGEPSQRIKEDYLRILRLFRFHAFYGQGTLDELALHACKDASDKISTLSRERITNEFLKILSVDNPIDVLTTMSACNVWDEVIGQNYKSDVMSRLCQLQKKYGLVNIEARLFVLAGCQPKLFEEDMRLSHVQKNFIIKLLMASNVTMFKDERTLKRAIYHHGNALMSQGYLLGVVMEKVDEDSKMIDFAQNWQAPKCPINGQTLMKEGYVTGPDLGQELKRREAEWLEEVI